MVVTNSKICLSTSSCVHRVSCKENSGSICTFGMTHALQEKFCESLASRRSSLSASKAIPQSTFVPIDFSFLRIDLLIDKKKV